MEPIIVAGDAAAITVASIVGGLAYQVATKTPAAEIAPWAGVGLIGSIAFALAAYRCDLYQPRELLQPRRNYKHYVRVCACWSWAILLVSVVLFFMKLGGEVSRGAMAFAATLSCAALLLWRATLTQVLRGAVQRRAIIGRPVMLLGTAEELASVRANDLVVWYGFEDVGRVVLPLHDCADIRELQAAAVAKALVQARSLGAEEIILALPWTKVTEIEFVREQLQLSPIPTRLLPDLAIQRMVSHQNQNPRLSALIEMTRAPLSASELIAKRTLDILLAAFAVTVLLPLMLLVAAVIRLESRGPAIFRQRRKGFNGEEYLIYKFRTMTVMEDGPAILQARKLDARVTRVGRILRQTSIDELPQLYNVLRGEMSLVGPRPHAVAHDDEYSQTIANYAFRHHVKPGITGWAQVHGHRGATPQLEQMAKRIELDLWYVNNWTFALDLQILLWTSVELVRGRNAY